jgi:peptidoglycan/xylan/chitin deacetylase (PgdA/CDA1 family)
MRVGIVVVVAGAVLGAAAYEAPGALAHSAASGAPAPTRSALAEVPAAVPVAGPAKPAATTASRSRPPRATSKPPVTTVSYGRGPAGSKMTTGGHGVALTFDDGPDPVQTPRILDLLAKYHVHATFCLVGRNVQANPDLVRRIVAEGHTVCNHSWKHDEQLGKKSPAAIEADLRATNDAIHAAAPDAKIVFMRAPGGNFTKPFVTVATRLGMKSLYWSVDPRDWDHSGGESDPAHEARVIAAIRRQARPGAIILSHDFGQPDTIAAYTQLLPWLTAHYTLIRLT